ncbi:MAG: 3-hydroxyacyl-[acyl-carrier-protein] dehydratase [Gammaproteobacteria bacterium]|jgi:3-hydroxyacyl-[acyl-carrier-protein] dehydratase|nr:3-hydroxyacyl-[acyl-carrier-protein] dehydratase [Gammaproteobacteria bacterium]
MSDAVIDINEIIKFIPHRYPFLLVDRIISIIPDQSIVAIKNVTMNEPFFQGHFPNKPVMPGVLILEAIAQAGGVLMYKQAKQNQGNGDFLFYLAGIDNARFKRIVEPGDQLRLEVNFIKAKREICKLSGLASVDGQLVCEADIICAKKGV